MSVKTITLSCSCSVLGVNPVIEGTLSLNISHLVLTSTKISLTKLLQSFFPFENWVWLFFPTYRHRMTGRESHNALRKPTNSPFFDCWMCFDFFLDVFFTFDSVSFRCWTMWISVKQRRWAAAFFGRDFSRERRRALSQHLSSSTSGAFFVPLCLKKKSRMKKKWSHRHKSFLKNRIKNATSS